MHHNSHIIAPFREILDKIPDRVEMKGISIGGYCKQRE
jgi:hypothetical protein